MRGKIQNLSRWNMSVLCRFGRIAAGYITSTNGLRGRCDEHFINGSYLHFKIGTRNWMVHFSLQTDILTESHFALKKKQKKTPLYKLSCASFFFFFLLALRVSLSCGWRRTEISERFFLFYYQTKHCLLFWKSVHDLNLQLQNTVVRFSRFRHKTTWLGLK